MLHVVMYFQTFAFLSIRFGLFFVYTEDEACSSHSFTELFT